MVLMRARDVGVHGRLHAVSLELRRGELLGLIGPNGSGKTTLLHCLAGLQACTGKVEFDGQPIAAIPPRRRARMIGLLPQQGTSAWSLSVRDVVGLGRLPWDDQDETAIARAMHRAGLTGLAGRAVDRLSGGEQARVWLARVLAGTPSLLLADEPVANLDLRHQHEVSRLLRDDARSGSAVVLALHDLSLAARYCDRLALLDRGVLRAIGTPAQVLEAGLLREVYGVAIAVRPEPDPATVFVGLPSTQLPQPPAARR